MQQATLVIVTASMEKNNARTKYNVQWSPNTENARNLDEGACSAVSKPP